MTSEKRRLSVDEIYALLKNSDLPTVLVEGKDDIIFYRAIEDELRHLDIDMLPAGNKHAVLELRNKIRDNPIKAPTVFIVDKDLWVHPQCELPENIDDVITTVGYSIENDLYTDGELECLLNPNEKREFLAELAVFCRWYSLAVTRSLDGKASSFRSSPGKVLDDKKFREEELLLNDEEGYPEEFYEDIVNNYSRVLRGKSLFSLLLRRLSHSKRPVKFSGKQLMAIGAARKGENFERIQLAVKEAFEQF